MPEYTNFGISTNFTDGKLKHFCTIYKETKYFKFSSKVQIISELMILMHDVQGHLFSVK